MRQLTLAAALGLLLLAFYGLSGTRSGHTVAGTTPSAPAAEVSPAASRVGVETSAPSLGTGQSLPAPAPVKADLSIAQALHSEDLYAQVVKHWNNYRAGGYARAMAMRLACQESLLLARSTPQGALPTSDTPSMDLQPASMSGESPLTASQRLDAWHRINRRCLPLIQDTQRMGAPPDDDPYEQAKARAWKSAPERVQQALLKNELAYGHLDQVLQSFNTRRTPAAGQVPWFEAQALGGAGRAELYDKALGMAAIMLYADASNPSPHLYALALCAQKGLCTGSLEERLLADYPAGSPERATILALYPRMMAAVLRGDLDAFEFRKKP